MFAFFKSVWAKCVACVHHTVETVKGWFVRTEAVAEPAAVENPPKVADQPKATSQAETDIIAQLDDQLHDLYAATFDTHVLAHIGIGAYRRLYQQITDPAVRQHAPLRPDQLKIVQVGNHYCVVDAASVARRNGKLVAR